MYRRTRLPLNCRLQSQYERCRVPERKAPKSTAGLRGTPPRLAARRARVSGFLELSVPLGMSRIHPECPDPDPSDRSAAADVLLRQEPDEEDEEEDEGDGKEDDDDDDEDDDGYSE